MSELPGPDGKKLPEGFEEFYRGYRESMEHNVYSLDGILRLAIAAWEAGEEYGDACYREGGCCCGRCE